MELREGEKQLEVPCFNKKEIEEIVKGVVDLTKKITIPKGAVDITSESFEVDPSVILTFNVTEGQAKELMESKKITFVIDFDTNDATFSYRRVTLEVVSSGKDADGDWAGTIYTNVTGTENSWTTVIRMGSVSVVGIFMPAKDATTQSQLASLFSAYKQTISVTVYYN